METRYVVGFMFNEKETDVLLIEKQKPKWQEGLFNGVGGKIEKGETSLSAIVREFKEETGIDSNEIDWRYVTRMSGDGWLVDVFTVKSDMVFYHKQMEEEKTHLIEIYELDKYPHVSNLQWLIPMCLDKDINYKVSNVESQNE